MSKKKKKDFQQSTGSVKQQKNQVYVSDKKTAIALSGILLLCLVIYWPLLKNDFVSLDDSQYVLNNPLIHHISFKNLFTTYWMGNYHPFVMLAYSVIYSVAHESPFAYHFSSLFIHLINTSLVLFLIIELTGVFEIAVIVSLFFGIHPMHAESVAWVSELKDLMYACFFLLSLLYYMKYAKQPALKKYFLLSLFFFLCSLFSKGMGASLSIVIILVDFYFKRKVSAKTIAEKIPFLILSVVFGIIAIKAQQATGAIPDLSYTGGERILIAAYGFINYIIQLIAPYQLSAYYLYPFKAGESIAAIYYFNIILILAITAAVIYSIKKTRTILFGTSFFIATIVLVLQLIPVGSAAMADRYSYIPSIGLFLLVATGLNYLYRNFKFKLVAIGLFIAMTIGYCYVARERIMVWKNSMALYNDMLASGDVPMAYGNRGLLYQNDGDLVKAESDFNKAIALSPNYKEAFTNRGNLNLALKKYDNALNDYNRVIQLEPSNPKSYYNRGILYYTIGDYEKASADFLTTIKIDPNIAEAHINLANIYDVNSKFNDALDEYTKAISLNPSLAIAFSNRALVYIKLNRMGEACNDLKQAASLGDKNAENSMREVCK